VQVVAWPAVTTAGAQTTEAVVAAWETVMGVVPGLAGAMLLVSPAYEAVMVVLPAPTVVTVT